MADVAYEFTKFPVAVDRLDREIRDSAIVTALRHVTLLGTEQLTVTMAAALSETDAAALTALVAAHGGLPLAQEPEVVNVNLPTNPRGHLIVEPGLRVGAAGTRGMAVLTPILSDKTTWYQRAVKVTDQALADAGNHQDYTALAPWINIRHPKLFYNEWMIPTRTGGFAKHSEYDVIVKKNGVTQTTGFTIDYRTGTVSFTAPLDPSDAVTATFYHLNGVSRPSEWLLTPPAGFKYVVEHVEMQFEKNVGVLQDTIVFEIWANPGFTTGTPKIANVAAYDAIGWAEPYFGQAWPHGATAMGQHRSRYRNIADVVNAANEGKGTIPACGELDQEILVIPFNYLQSFVIDSQMGTVFRLHTANHAEISAVVGCLVTATFYLQLAPSDK